MIAAAWVLVAVSVAPAQTLPNPRERDGAASNYLYTVPNVVRITPGTARLLYSHCDPDYPQDEFMPCDTATGGPVGGRGS